MPGRGRAFNTLYQIFRIFSSSILLEDPLYDKFQPVVKAVISVIGCQTAVWQAIKTHSLISTKHSLQQTVIEPPMLGFCGFVMSIVRLVICSNGK